jgi:hypothetical protein
VTRVWTLQNAFARRSDARQPRLAIHTELSPLMALTCSTRNCQPGRHQAPFPWPAIIKLMRKHCAAPPTAAQSDFLWISLKSDESNLIANAWGLSITRIESRRKAQVCLITQMTRVYWSNRLLVYRRGRDNGSIHYMAITLGTVHRLTCI